MPLAPILCNTPGLLGGATRAAWDTPLDTAGGGRRGTRGGGGRGTGGGGRRASTTPGPRPTRGGGARGTEAL